MGQGEIMEFLKKNKGNWFSVKEIQPHAGSGITSATKCIAQLRYSGFVDYKRKDDSARVIYVYRYREVTKDEMQEL